METHFVRLKISGSKQPKPVERRKAHNNNGWRLAKDEDEIDPNHRVYGTFSNGL